MNTILNLLGVIHSMLGAASLYFGAVALSRIFAGRPFEQPAVVFLKCALAASVIGLLFPVHLFQPAHWAAMATVYVAAMAVIAWRRFHLSQVWGLVFTLSLMAVLWLDVLVAVQHVFNWLPALGAAAPAPARLLFLVAESVVTLFFVTLGIFAVRRYQNKPSYSI